jgi:hypothetical protein
MVLRRDGVAAGAGAGMGSAAGIALAGASTFGGFGGGVSDLVIPLLGGGAGMVPRLPIPGSWIFPVGLAILGRSGTASFGFLGLTEACLGAAA